MSTKKTKSVFSFRTDAETIDQLKKMVGSDPVVFRSTTSVVDAALYHFLKLPKSEQKQIIKDYLTKDL